MNEELKIIIKAVTAEAEKNLESVRKELDKVAETAQESGSAVDRALQTMKKGATIAIASITALTTALVTLGKRSLEFRKIQAQLVAGFQSVGSSAEQAMITYKELYGFLGDAGQAGETATLLGQLTQDEAELAEWTETLMGVYAKFSSSLPVESLAEAVNHTAQLGEVQGTLADALEWVGVSVEDFNAALANTSSLEERETLIRSTLNGLYGSAAQYYSQANQALIAYNQSQVAVDQALSNATNYVIPLMTALNNLSATLLSILKPAFETVASVIIVFVQWIIAAIKAVGSFFGVFTGGSSATKEVADNVGAVSKNTDSLNTSVGGLNDSLGSAVKTAKELKRQTMGFDELNVMSSTSTTSSSGSGASGGAGSGIDVSGIEIPTVDDIDLPGLEDFEKKVEKVRKILIPIATLVGAVAAGLLLWKIVDFVTDLTNAYKILNMPMSSLFEKFGTTVLKAKINEASATMETLLNKVKLFGGVLLIIAGAILLVKGYSDAWINGLDWGNFAMILGGIAAIVGGITLAFGPMAGAIALAVGGVVALVIGIKDLITNGYSMEAVLMVAAGAIAVVIGAIWAFNSALLANPITWVVVGIMALVAAFVILWNECEGFRNFWIAVWEKVKVAFQAFLKSCQPIFDAMKNAFNELWELIKVVWGLVVAKFKSAWEDIKAVWNLVKPFFAAIWEGIKAIFSVVKSVLGGFFSAAWTGIKAVWSGVVNYFAAIWNSIAGIFSVVKNVLQGNWQGAWNAIKGIVGTWVNYFKGIWSGIKSIFSDAGTFFGKIGTKISDAVTGAIKGAVNAILKSIVNKINGFISMINAAIGIINKIPGVNISKLSKLSVPQLATGGIVSSATVAMIGERGKEAVLPLENNTEWMDALADKIANRSSSPSRIVLMLDGKELGYAAINSINGITRQTGQLQLTVI